jgi:hypothetical protein
MRQNVALLHQALRSQDIGVEGPKIKYCGLFWFLLHSYERRGRATAVSTYM